MWFDVGAARAGRRQPAPIPASLANPANQRVGLAGLAKLAGAPVRAGDAAPSAVPDLADALDDAEKRAAIMEHDGGLPRAEAERLALAGVACPEARRVLRERWGAGR